MENVGYAALQIIPSFDGMEHRLVSGTSGPLRSAGLLGGKAFGDSAGRSITSSMTAHAKRAALLSGAVISAAAVAAFKLGKDSIAEARESQKVGALTTQVIKTTGGAAHVTAKQVGELSTALSLKSGIDDEVIQRGANMLLTFKDIRNEVGKNNDIFNQSVAITQDMAAAMAGGQGGDIDLKSSSILVGKALNDPVKGLTALTRVGVSFTDQQKKQIEALVKSGDTMAAQKIILGELQSEFGGAAAAQATMGEKVKTAWGNIEEQLGNVLLPLVDDAERAFLHKGVPAIEGWVDAFKHDGVPAIHDFAHFMRKDGLPALSDFYDEAKPVAQDVLPAIFDVMKAGRPVLRVTAGLVGDLADAFTKIPHWAQVAIAGGLLAGKVAGPRNIAGGIGSLFGGKRGGVLGGVSKAAPLPVFVTNNLPGLGDDPIPGKPGSKFSTPGKFATAGGYAATAAFGAYALYQGQKNVRGTFEQATSVGAQGLTHGASSSETGVDARTRLTVQLAGADRASGDVTHLLEDFLALPKKVQTEIATKGSELSKKQALDVAKQYHLTPTQVRTLFDTSGIPGGITAAKKWAQQIAGVPTNHRTIFETNIQSVQSQIASLVASIHAIPSIGSADVPFVHGGQRGASGSPRSLTPRTEVHVHVGNEYLGSFIEDGAKKVIDRKRRRDAINGWSGS